MRSITKIIAVALAAALAGCTALESAPADFDPASVPRDLVDLTVAPWPQTMASCVDMLGPFGLLTVGCACYREDPSDISQEDGGMCTVPAGKLCVVHSVSDGRTLDHELAHCAMGNFHGRQDNEGEEG